MYKETEKLEKIFLVIKNVLKSKKIKTKAISSTVEMIIKSFEKSFEYIKSLQRLEIKTGLGILKQRKNVCEILRKVYCYVS